MHGTNPVAKARTADQGFLVHSIFYTIQGEGPFAGLPAIFLRLAGCNLRCFWCDTEFEKLDGLQAGDYTAAELAEQLDTYRKDYNCDLIVITGGEPMLQPIPSLIWACEPFADLHFQIETAGTVWPDGMDECLNGFDDPEIDHSSHCEYITIVTSPKTAKVHPRIETETDAWKYIIRADATDPDDGLPIESTQQREMAARLYRPNMIDADVPHSYAPQSIYVQPCDELGIHRGRANVEEAARIAMKFGYRLSIQLHKIAGLD